MSRPSTGVALIGAGYISYMHLLGLRAVPGLRLTAIASRTLSAAQHRGRIFDAEPYAFDDLPAMLSRGDVQLAIVASPNALHFDHAMAALAHKIPVVIEKPLVLTLDEADALARAAADHEVGIGYAENLVFAPIVRRAREVVAGGALGRIKSARCDFKHGGPAATGWFRSMVLAGGGAHIDLGCHALEMLLYLLGHPAITRVRDCTMTIDPTSGLDLTASCGHETAEGVVLTTDASWVEPNGVVHAVLEGEDGILTLALSAGALTLQRKGGEAETLDYPWRKDFTIAAGVARQGYVGQLAHFADALQTGARPSEGVAEGTNILRLLLAAYASAATGAPVDPSGVSRELSPIATWRSLRK